MLEVPRYNYVIEEQAKANSHPRQLLSCEGSNATPANNDPKENGKEIGKLG